MPWPGSALAGGRLQVVRLLGRGANGVVFEAVDTARCERVALKMLSHVDGSGIYHLKNEFRALSDIRHPNLARLYELLNLEGSWYLTMECVDGEPFDAWTRPGGVLDEARLRGALAQLIAALAALHAQATLHRDLKPSNVLVTREGRLVVLDFGLAVDAHTRVGQTVTGDVGGTPAYMAPEHAFGAPARESSDAYSVGVMLYEALTGQVPYSGTAVQMFVAKQHGAPSWPVALEAELPADLKELCMSLLSHEPDVRPSMHDVMTAVLSGMAAEREPGSQQDLTVHRVVGRSAELTALRAAFRESAERATLIAVRGSSGIGKTALCQEFLDDLQGELSVAVLRSRCYEHETVPFKALDPLVDALGRQLRRMAPAEAGSVLPREVFALTHLFPSLGRIELIARMPAKRIVDRQELQRRAFNALLEWLARLRDRQPVVVFIDDLQWACADSLHALQQMLVERSAPPILLVLAYRDDAPHIASAVQPVLETARVNPSWQVHELPLPRLSEATSAELAAQLFQLVSVGPDASLFRAIAREGSGNPFLIREIARFALRGGSLASAVSLAAVLASHLELLSTEARDLVQLVAMVGEPLQLDVALKASGATLLDVDHLRSGRLIRTGANNERAGRIHIECFHDRIREEIAARADEFRARTLFSRLSAVLSAEPELDHQLLSRCLEQAGQRADAADHALKAAREADQAMAFDRGVRLYAKCMQLGEHDAPSLRSLTIALGTAQANAGDGATAAETFLRAAGSERGDAATDLRRRAAEQWLATGYAARGTELLRSVCRELDIALPRSPHATLARFAWKQLQLRTTHYDARRPAATHVSGRNELRMRAARTAVLGLLGYYPLQCSCVAVDYLSMAFEIGGVPDRIRALGFAGYLLSQADPRGGRAHELLRQMNELALTSGDLELIGFAHMMLGAHALFSGARDARQMFDKARTAFADCSGVHWELDATNFHDQFAAFDCGDFADIARTAPVRIQEARRRGRLYSAAMFTGFSGIVAWLVPDDVEACHQELRDQMRVWEQRGDGGWPDFLLMIGHAMLHLYKGTPEVGLSILEAHQRRFNASLLTRRATALRSHRGYWRMCAASALHVARVSGDSARRKTLAAALRQSVQSGHRAAIRGRGRTEVVHAALALDVGNTLGAAAGT